MADQRLDFVRFVLDAGVSITAASAEFGFSRTTGHKILNRFAAEGVAGLTDRSRSPIHRPQSVDEERCGAIRALKARHLTWGPKKLRAYLMREHPDAAWPATSTFGEILSRAGLVSPRRTRYRCPHSGRPLTQAQQANHVWCIDYKGQFRMGDGRWCYPLTITDDDSRFLLRCQALGDTSAENAWPYFVGAFIEFGLPQIIRSDNGAPFAVATLTGITSLSLRLLKLGIMHERMAPAKPTQNPRHERMHRTLKAEALPARHAAAQQMCFNSWRQIYNSERPHEGIGLLTPSDRYEASPRPYPRIMPQLEYPQSMRTVRVRPNGSVRLSGRDETYIGQVLAGEHIGLDHFESCLYAVYVGPKPVAVYDESAKAMLPPRKAQAHLKTLPPIGGK